MKDCIVQFAFHMPDGEDEVLEVTFQYYSHTSLEGVVIAAALRLATHYPDHPVPFAVKVIQFDAAHDTMSLALAN